MRNILLLLLITLSSCSDKYKALSELNQAPQLVFSKDTVFARINDTVTKRGEVFIKTFDREYNQTKLICFDSTNGKMQMYYDKQIINGDFPIINDSTKIYVVATEDGLYRRKIIVEDRFGKKAEKYLYIKTIQNTPPVADFVYKKISTFEYELDGSAAYDNDGVIKIYQYQIDGITIESSVPIIRHIFYTTGLKTVQLRVIDDYGSISTSTTKTILIQ